MGSGRNIRYSKITLTPDFSGAFFAVFLRFRLHQKKFALFRFVPESGVQLLADI